MGNKEMKSLKGAMLAAAVLGAFGENAWAEQEIEPPSKGVEVTEYSYDERGNLILKTVSWNGGEPEVLSYEYDEKNNLVRMLDKQTDGSSTVQTVEYGDQDNGSYSVTEVYVEKGGVKTDLKHMRTELVYHDAGYTETVRTDTEDLVTVTEVDNTLGKLSVSMQKADGTEQMREVYEYNEAGKLVLKKTSDGDEGSSGRTGKHDGTHIEEAYEYDGNGFLLKKSGYVVKGTMRLPMDSSEYENDADGNCLERRDYSGSGALKNSEAFVYDEQGNVVKDTLSDSSGRVLSETLSEYNEEGVLIRETRTIS